MEGSLRQTWFLSQMLNLSMHLPCLRICALFYSDAEIWECTASEPPHWRVVKLIVAGGFFSPPPKVPRGQQKWLWSWASWHSITLIFWFGSFFFIFQKQGLTISLLPMRSTLPAPPPPFFNGKGISPPVSLTVFTYYPPRFILPLGTSRLWKTAVHFWEFSNRNL